LIVSIFWLILKFLEIYAPECAASPIRLMARAFSDCGFRVRSNRKIIFQLSHFLGAVFFELRFFVFNFGTQFGTFLSALIFVPSW